MFGTWLVLNEYFLSDQGAKAYKSNEGVGGGVVTAQDVTRTG